MTVDVTNPATLQLVTGSDLTVSYSSKGPQGDIKFPADIEERVVNLLGDASDASFIFDVTLIYALPGNVNSEQTHTQPVQVLLSTLEEMSEEEMVAAVIEDVLAAEGVGLEDLEEIFEFNPDDFIGVLADVAGPDLEDIFKEEELGGLLEELEEEGFLEEALGEGKHGNSKGGKN